MIKALLFCILAANNPLGSAFQPVDANGKPYVGAKLYTYGAGGLIAATTYSDYNLVTPHANPVVADGKGKFAPIYLSAGTGYKFVLKTAAGVTLWTIDNLYGDRSEYTTNLVGTSTGATAAVQGTNTGAGPALKGIASGGTGHGLWVESDTSTPARAAIHMVSQDATPTVPIEGDLWMLDATGRLWGYDGTEASAYMFANKAVGTASTAAGVGVTGTGNTTGDGVVGTGGATSGDGVTGNGGAPNGNGVVGQGDGTGDGGSFSGGDNSGYGVIAWGGASNGIGGIFYGNGIGQGVYATGGDTNTTGVYGVGGTTNGPGVTGQGSGSGAGIVGTGGATAGADGVTGTGGAGGGDGLVGTGTLTGVGARLTGGASGAYGAEITGGAGVGGGGVNASAGAGGGYGVYALGIGSGYAGVVGKNDTGYGVIADGDTSSPGYATLRLVPQDNDPTNCAIGDIYVNTAGIVHVCTAIGPCTWTHIGVQP